MNLRWMLLPGYLLLLLLLFTLIQGEVKQRSHSFSVVGLVPLLELEQKLIDNLEEYAKAMDQKLQIIRSHILTMRAENNKAKLDAIYYLSNPVNGFSLIRRLHQDWAGWRNYLEQPVGPAQMRKFNTWRNNLPTKEDLWDACEGIVRIQNLYGLKISDIIGGELLGWQYNGSMSSLDIYAVGQYLFKTSRPSVAIQWLREVTDSQKNLLPPELSVKEEGLLQLLALAHKQNNSYSDALDLLDRCLEFRPCDAALLRHRREVEELIGNPLNATSEKTEKASILTDIARACNPASMNTTGLHCFYNFVTTPFLRLAPLKVEQVGLDPYVVLYHEVLSPREISIILDTAMLRMAKTGTVDTKTTNSQTHHRTAMGHWESKKSSEVTQRITRRIRDMTGLELEESEAFQIINYGIGGHYAPHHDYFNSSTEYALNDHLFQIVGDRIATVLFYLSDVELGGATAFTKPGYNVSPRAGTALFWYNLHTNGSCDVSSRHTACPMIVGSKWVMTEWIRERRQMFIKPCLPREKGASPVEG